MLLSEIFNEKYEFEKVFVEESDEKGYFKVVDEKGNIVFDKMITYIEAVVWASKIGETVSFDINKYIDEYKSIKIGE